MTDEQRQPTTAELVDVLQRAVALVRNHFAVTTARLGVTPVQAKALGHLAEPLTLKELSARLGADLSNTATSIDRLESQGLVQKQIHPTDRRARLVTLTAAGEALRTQLDEQVFGAVPALAVLDANQQRELYALLELVVSQ
ncbi:MarR family winged helix-turn-helix transcriptional regulator [Nocardia sp. NPDC004711]